MKQDHRFLGIYKLDISKNASFEEMQDAIRVHLNNPDFVLPMEEYEHFIELNKQEEEIHSARIKNCR